MKPKFWAGKPSVYDVKNLPTAMQRTILITMLRQDEVLVEPIGFEPMTLCLQSRCSTN